MTNDILAPSSGPGCSESMDESQTQVERGRRSTGGAELDIIDVFNVLLRHWRIVIWIPLVTVLIAVFFCLFTPNRYTASVSFLPEQETDATAIPSSVAGLAAEFGVSILGGGGGSPEFYADILRSRSLSDRLLLSVFSDPRSDASLDSAPLHEILEISGDSEQEILEDGRDLLEEVIAISIENQSNIVSASVETKHKTLSADLANRLLDLLNEFNLQTRRSSAMDQREFVGNRVQEAETELENAENQLRSFLEKNRLFRDSPQLQFQYERLQRQVAIKQEIVTSLRRSYEEARIQEVNDTPVLTVVDTAVVPAKKSSPKRKLIVALSLLLGVVAGFIAAFTKEYSERVARSKESRHSEFRKRWSEWKKDVKSPRGWIRRTH